MLPRDRILMPGPALLEESLMVHSQFSQTLICFDRNSAKQADGGNALPNFPGPGPSNPSLSQRNVFQQLNQVNLFQASFNPELIEQLAEERHRNIVTAAQSQIVALSEMAF